MAQFKKMKMRINNPDHSKAVQEWLFDQGYFWDYNTDVKFHNTDSPVLFASTFNKGHLGYGADDGFYRAHPGEEVDVQHLDPHLYTKQTSPCNPSINSYHKKTDPKSEIEKLSTQLKHLDKAIDSHENKQNKRKLDRERIIEKLESMLPEGYGVCLTEAEEGDWGQQSLLGSVWKCVGAVAGFTQGTLYQVTSFNEEGYPEMLNDEGHLGGFWSLHNFEQRA